MNRVGGVFGFIGLLCVLFLASRPVLLAVVNRYRKADRTIPGQTKKLLQFVTRYHRFVGLAAFGLILLHATLQYLRYDHIPAAGLVAGVLLLLQGALGFLMTKEKDKDKRKRMALGHRNMGIMLLVAILVHRIIGFLTTP